MTCNYNPCTDGSATAEDVVGELPLTGSGPVALLLGVAIVLLVLGLMLLVAGWLNRRDAR